MNDIVLIDVFSSEYWEATDGQGNQVLPVPVRMDRAKGV